MESASSIFWGLLIVVALVVVNAFFVAAEYALVRVRRTRMEALAAQGSSSGHASSCTAWTISVATSPASRWASPSQGSPQGVLVNRSWQTLFDPLFAWLFPPWLLGPEVSTALTTGLALLVISYLLVVLSELVPKAITLQYAEQVALLVAKPMQWLWWCLRR